MSFIIIYVTFPNKEEAGSLSEHLVKKKLIACSNIFPMTSCFPWKGKIDNSNEYVSILKTKNENWERVKQEVQKLHSYDIPCIMKINIEANKEFEDWIQKEIKNAN